MRAAILHKFNRPLTVDEMEPQPLDVGQVLVRIEAATICGAQIGEVTGAKGHDPYLPHLLGHEGCGFVERVGVGVRRVEAGEKVILHWRKASGIEASPPKYRWKHGFVGGGPVSTFATHAVVSENRLTPVPIDIPSDIGSLFGCAVTTAFGLINNEAQLKIGQSIAVAGCGGVGLNVIQAASLVAGNPIIAIDKHSTKLAMARMAGAHFTIGTTEVDLSAAVRGIMNKGGVDVFVDCTGSAYVIDAGLTLTAPGGKLVLVGQPAHGQAIAFTNMRQNYCGKTILDSQGGLTQPDKDIPRYLKLWRQGTFLLDNVITDRFPLDRINDAMALAQRGHSGRIVLEMW